MIHTLFVGEPASGRGRVSQMMVYGSNRMKIARILALISILWAVFGAQAVHPYFHGSQPCREDQHAGDCSAESIRLQACSEAESSITSRGQVHWSGECPICKFLKNTQLESNRSRFVLATADRLPELRAATEIAVLQEKAFLLLLSPRAPPCL